ncbi:hypothetical protein D3C84_720560 [compost metagenome]
MFQHRAKGQPDLGMTQVGRQAIEDEHQVRHAEQCVAADLTATGIPEATREEAQAGGDAELLDDLLHKMHPTRGGRHQHGRRVMHLVKRPEPARMKRPVRPVVDEILHQEHP